jgi:hypothetical protein
MLSSGMLCHVTVVRTDVLEERSSLISRVTRIGELEISCNTLQHASVASYS